MRLCEHRVRGCPVCKRARLERKKAKLRAKTAAKPPKVRVCRRGHRFERPRCLTCKRMWDEKRVRKFHRGGEVPLTPLVENRYSGAWECGLCGRLLTWGVCVVCEEVGL